MNLPALFVQNIQEILGKEQAEHFICSLKSNSPTSLRLNRNKTSANLVTPSEPIPWSSEGRYLGERLNFTFDPMFHAGAYYVQEASSMFLEQAIKQYIKGPVTALDLCAAPGGKSTLLSSLIDEKSLLVSNEVIRSRAQILMENMIKWGASNSVVTNNDPKDFVKLQSFFDLIVADVPCSGEGMFRKDNESIKEWSGENVDICWQRQRRIISDVWGALKHNGLLIYSTCTYNTKENEENINWIINEFDAEVLPIEVDSEWNILGNVTSLDFPVYRFMPHQTKGEGFFMAVIRKKSGSEANVSRKIRKNKKGKGSNKDVFPKEVKQWITSPEKYTFSTKENLLSALPLAHENEITQIFDSLKVLHAGVPLATVKGKNLIPTHALAMSNELNKSLFTQKEVTYAEAISFLRKEALAFPDDPKGYLLLTYDSVPLGFVKNIGNRANNLYPNEWKIRSQYLPEDLKIIELK